MYVMYIHIKAVTYVTFPNKQDSSWADRSTRGIVKHVYILVVCPYNVCDDLVEKCRKKPSLPCEKRITKTQELWTYI